ncbi:MAG: helix-turn-helix transcriptional regulator [Bacteroidales bacterium]|jgi:transcriptional regulator with XRE-family HTH domain|nr:helix-turn-helix transcriptional regulator [Bacteroidales bacterium]
MNNRLQQFLELENISPARLADLLGIQRSGISHILSGRNKPSYDFILKLLTKFPSINPEWLITGKGKPYKDIYTTPVKKIGEEPLADLNENPPAEENGSFFPAPSDNFTKSNESMEFPGRDNSPYNTDKEHISPQNSDKQLNENLINENMRAYAHKSKSVKRVIIYFNDGTFEEFFPSR